MDSQTRKVLLSLQINAEWLYYNKYFLDNCSRKNGIIRTNSNIEVISDRLLDRINGLAIKHFRNDVRFDIVEFNLKDQSSIDYHDVFFDRMQENAVYKIMVIPYFKEKQIFGRLRDNRLLYSTCEKPKKINFNLYKPILLDLFEDIRKLTKIDE